MVTVIEFSAVFFGLAIITGIMTAILHKRSEREESVLKATGTIHAFSAIGMLMGLLMAEFLFRSNPVSLVWYSLPAIVVVGGLFGGGLFDLLDSSE